MVDIYKCEEKSIKNILMDFSREDKDRLILIASNNTIANRLFYLTDRMNIHCEIRNGGMLKNIAQTCMEFQIDILDYHMIIDTAPDVKWWIYNLLYESCFQVVIFVYDKADEIITNGINCVSTYMEYSTGITVETIREEIPPCTIEHIHNTRIAFDLIIEKHMEYITSGRLSVLYSIYIESIVVDKEYANDAIKSIVSEYDNDDLFDILEYLSHKLYNIIDHADKILYGNTKTYKRKKMIALLLNIFYALYENDVEYLSLIDCSVE